MLGRENEGPLVGCSTVSAKGLKIFYYGWAESRTEAGDMERSQMMQGSVYQVKQLV